MAIGQTTTENDIQLIAYQLWESEGEPEGQDSRHWHMAKEISVNEASSSNETITEKQSDELDIPGGSENTASDTEIVRPFDAIELQEPEEPEEINGSHH